MENFDCVVIGAGAVGLAIARELSLAGRDVQIVAAENAFGTHTSARNSEVIHAGLSYPAGSLKARRPERLQAFCDTMGMHVGTLVRPARSPEEAVRGSDIIVTMTRD